MAPRVAVQPEAKDMPPDPVFGNTARNQGGAIGYYVKVIKAIVFGAIEGAKEAVVPLSKQLANSKKRSRVFAIEDSESTIVDHTDNLRP